MRRRRDAAPEPDDAPSLCWAGKPASTEVATPLALSPIEHVGGTPDDAGGLLIQGDNLDAARALLPTFAGRVDLAYLDPPFATGSDFVFTARGGAAEQLAYRDRHGGLGAYLSAMLERLRLVRLLLSPQGTVFVHCDWHASHWLRCLLDEVFGAGAFKNEIVWRYRRWPAKTKVFQRMHDVILWYGRSPENDHPWTPRFEPLAPSTVQTWGDRKQVADFSSGRRRPSQTDEPTPGAPLSDVWDIGIIAPIAHERVGYPTQKPEALLRRVIEAASRPGDLVMDLFAGSGTTLAVAEKLGRRWIGCDAGAPAVHIAKKRLVAAGARPFAVATIGPRAEASPSSRLDASVERDASGHAVGLALRGVDFAVAAPTELRVRGRLRAASWVDLVDYWSVGTPGAGAGHPFTALWQGFRPRPNDPLPLLAPLPAAAEERLAVQVIDVFGGESRCEIRLEDHSR